MQWPLTCTHNLTSTLPCTPSTEVAPSEDVELHVTVISRFATEVDVIVVSLKALSQTTVGKLSSRYVIRAQSASCYPPDGALEIPRKPTSDRRFGSNGRLEYQPETVTCCGRMKTFQTGAKDELRERTKTLPGIVIRSSVCAPITGS